TNSDQVVGGASVISTLTIDNTGTPAVTPGTQAGNTSFTGILGGSGANQNNLALTLHMASANNVTLQNTNTYVGNTKATSGTLAIGTATVAGSIASPNISVSSGATFTVAAMGSIASSANLTNNGTVNIRNAATTVNTLNGSGSLSLASAALTVANGGSYS